MTSFVCMHVRQNMAEKKKKRLPGKSCAAGGPGLVSCTNTNATPGVSMHQFPSDEATRRQWVKFVHKHRPDFKPTNSSYLCSVHFAPECFTRRIDLLDPDKVLSGSHHIYKGSIPTNDVALKPADQPDTTDRDRRMVSVPHYFHVY